MSPRAASCSTRSSATSARWTTWCPSSTPRPRPCRRPPRGPLAGNPDAQQRTPQQTSLCQTACAGVRAAGTARRNMLCMGACQAWTSSMPAASAVLGRCNGVHGGVAGVALCTGTCPRVQLFRVCDIVLPRFMPAPHTNVQARAPWTRPRARARVAGLRLGLAGLQQGRRQAGAGDHSQPGPAVHQGEG